MEILNSTTVFPDNVAVALGAFDGIHMGHRKLIENVVEYARNNGCKSCVYTFDKLPSGAERILNDSQRNNILEGMGVDYLYLQHFDGNFKCMPAEDFMNKYLLQSQYISVGFDFRFGAQRLGDTNMLKSFCADNNIKIDVVEPVMLGEDVVSSTKIRGYIKDADFSSVKNMLGRPFSVEGTVCHGNEIGRTIGFPTANMTVAEGMVMPPKGVYVTAVEYDGNIYKAFTNYGTKPTFDDNSMFLETHLFDFNGNLYDKTINVYFFKKLRDIVKFNSAEALKAQLTEDKNKSLEFFSKNGLQI